MTSPDMFNLVDVALSCAGKPTRPVSFLTIVGSKKSLVNTIVPLIGQRHTRVYVEPYVGSGAILFNKPRHEIEVINDLDERLINLYHVMADQQKFEALKRLIVLTPNSHEDYTSAIEAMDSDDVVERAWGFFVAHTRTHSGALPTPGRWARTLNVQSRGMATTSSNIRTRLNMLDRWHERLQGVEMLNEDALDVIRRYDGTDVLFYLDPPYVFGSRAGRDRVYRHESTVEHHVRLVNLLQGVKGAVILSGYASEVYSQLERGWSRIEVVKPTLALTAGRNMSGVDALRERVEVIWVKGIDLFQ